MGAGTGVICSDPDLAQSSKLVPRAGSLVSTVSPTSYLGEGSGGHTVITVLPSVLQRALLTSTTQQVVLLRHIFSNGSHGDAVGKEALWVLKLISLEFGLK